MGTFRSQKGESLGTFFMQVALTYSLISTITIYMTNVHTHISPHLVSTIEAVNLRPGFAYVSNDLDLYLKVTEVKI